MDCRGKVDRISTETGSVVYVCKTNAVATLSMRAYAGVGNVHGVGKLRKLNDDYGLLAISESFRGRLMTQDFHAVEGYEVAIALGALPDWSSTLPFAS